MFGCATEGLHNADIRRKTFQTWTTITAAFVEALTRVIDARIPTVSSSNCRDKVTPYSTLWGSPEIFAFGPMDDLLRFIDREKALCRGFVNECSHTDIPDTSDMR